MNISNIMNISNSNMNQNHSIDENNPQNYDSGHSLSSTNIGSKMITPNKSTFDHDLLFNEQTQEKEEEENRKSPIVQVNSLINQCDNRPKSIKNSEENEKKYDKQEEIEKINDKEISYQINPWNLIRINSNSNFRQFSELITPKTQNLGNELSYEQNTGILCRKDNDKDNLEN